MNFSKLKLSISRFISLKNKTIDTNNNSQVIKVTRDGVKINSENTKVIRKYSEFIEWENQMMKDVGLNFTMSRYPKSSNGKIENDIEVIFIRRKSN
jgi:hypothetical protein